MSYSLTPPSGAAFLDTSEILRRLRAEFHCVDADPDEGAEQIGNKIAKLIELNAPQHIIDTEIENRHQTFLVVISDDIESDAYLSFLLQPNSEIRIAFSSAQHESAAESLLRRLERILNYSESP